MSTSKAKLRSPQRKTKESSEGNSFERQQKIAEAAYYRAERRGFAPGQEECDWLDAEKEIDGQSHQS
jgi:hypothetical protein